MKCLFPALFSDGQVIGCIVPHEDVFNIKTIFQPSTSSEGEICHAIDKSSDTMLKLTKKSMFVFGCGIISELMRPEAEHDDRTPINISE